MKKIISIRAFLCVLLVVIMVVSQGVPVSAETKDSCELQVIETDFAQLVEQNVVPDDLMETYVTQLHEAENVEFACEVYNNLSDEAKVLFETQISRESELLAFHKTYVNPDYIVRNPRKKAMASASAGANMLTTLSNNLNAIKGLPTEVIYTLEAMGASMVAAMSDGPLPVGDILLAAATVTAAVVIAANWDTVSLVWSDIISAFAKAFGTSAANIRSAFKTIKSDAEAEVERNRPPVVINGKEVYIAGSRFLCSAKADELTKKEQEEYRYYPALIVGSMLYVDRQHGFTNQNQCKIFVLANNRRVGLWATKQSYARGICGGNSAIWHQQHDSSEGYFYHYHHYTCRKFHCWYL